MANPATLVRVAVNGVWMLLALLLIAVLGACSSPKLPPSESATLIPDAEPLSGTITFGSAERPEASFRLSDEVAWSALLTAPVDDRTVNIVIMESGDETELFGYEQVITDPGETTLVNQMRLGRFLRQPGAYVMRYVNAEGKVLAEGQFQLVSD